MLGVAYTVFAASVDSFVGSDLPLLCPSFPRRCARSFQPATSPVSHQTAPRMFDLPIIFSFLNESIHWVTKGSKKVSWICSLLEPLVNARF